MFSTVVNTYNLGKVKYYKIWISKLCAARVFASIRNSNSIMHEEHAAIVVDIFILAFIVNII